MKSLHIALTALGAVFLSLSAPQVVRAQTRPSPVIDGISSLEEYGNGYRSTAENNPDPNNPNLTWRMTWDDTYLYVAIEDANLTEGAVIYLDTDPQIPVNNSVTVTGFSSYNSTNGKLPFLADAVIFFERNYREFRLFDRQNGQWSSTSTVFTDEPGTYANTGFVNEDTPDKKVPGEFYIREVKVRWADISTTGRRPENFNWFGQIHYLYDPIGDQPNPNLGGTYGQVPRENPRGDKPRLNYEDYIWSYYFTVLNTSAGSDTNAFGPQPEAGQEGLPSYSYISGANNTFNFFRVYDFTHNVPSVTINRTDAGSAQWDILGNIVVGPSSLIDFSASAAPVNLVGDIIIDPSGSLSFQNTGATANFRVGGDIRLTGPINSANPVPPFQTSANLILNGNGDQTIIGSTYRALTVEGGGTKTLTSDMSITSTLAVNNGTLATGSNLVTLEQNATFSEADNGYLLGNIQATRNITTPGVYNFGGAGSGGIGLTINSPAGNEGNVTARRITGGFGVTGNPNDPLVNKTIRRRFFITGGRPNVNTKLEFSYRYNSPNELEGNDPTTLKLYSSTDRTGSYTVVTPDIDNRYQRLGSFSTTTNTVTYTGALALDNTYYSLRATNPNPLPVELISFTGKAENNAVRLAWATATELQNKGFEIEHRTDLGEWKNIGFVSGNGTTNQRSNYNYLDRSALAGVNNYYRLRQIDLDGKSVYSQPVTVQLGSNGLVAFSVSPVPTTDVLTLNGLSAGKHVAEIYNARGQRVMSQEFKDSAPATLSVRALPVGVYMVRVLGANRSVQNARFIKQ